MDEYAAKHVDLDARVSLSAEDLRDIWRTLTLKVPHPSREFNATIEAEYAKHTDIGDAGHTESQALAFIKAVQVTYDTKEGEMTMKQGANTVPDCENPGFAIHLDGSDPIYVAGRSYAILDMGDMYWINVWPEEQYKGGHTSVCAAKSRLVAAVAGIDMGEVDDPLRPNQRGRD